LELSAVKIGANRYLVILPISPALMLTEKKTYLHSIEANQSMARSPNLDLPNQTKLHYLIDETTR
jgi:hypothetical protein